MTRAWYLQPDGTYKQLSHIEDLITDLTHTCEDVDETFRDFREVAAESRAIWEQSRLLVQWTQRDRRLRKSLLRLVKPLA